MLYDYIENNAEVIGLSADEINRLKKGMPVVHYSTDFLVVVLKQEPPAKKSR